MQIILFVVGLVPLAIVLLMMQARGGDNWLAIVGGVAYLIVLRRGSSWAAGKIKRKE